MEDLVPYHKVKQPHGALNPPNAAVNPSSAALSPPNTALNSPPIGRRCKYRKRCFGRGGARRSSTASLRKCWRTSRSSLR
eukprot:205812-Prorocentrum_minimum.AAC.1